MIPNSDRSALLRTIFSVSLFAYVFLFLTISGCTKKGVKIETQPTEKSRSASLITSGRYRAVAVSDLDNDGNQDVVGGASKPGIIRIWYGDGRGSFSEFQDLPLNGDIRSISVGDIDNDGFNDIAYSVQREDSGIRVWLNQAGRKWAAGENPSNDSGFEGIELTDINLDGFEDIIAANFGEGIKVWLGDGKGNWLLESGPVNKGAYMDIVLADFDKDGELDMAASGWGHNGSLRIWFGDGTGAWISIPPLATGSFYRLHVEDINGDNNLDILAGTYRQGGYIFLGDGSDGFIQAPFPFKEETYWAVLPIDLNGDKIQDLVASSIDNKGIKAWFKELPDDWQETEGQFPPTGIFYDLAVGDFDNDGIQDMIAASSGEGIKIWLGKQTKMIGRVSQSIRKITSSVVEKEVAENSAYTTVEGVPQYKIGPGDELDITLWTGNKKEVDTVTVREDGKIAFRFIQNLDVADLTIAEVDDRLTNALKKYIRSPGIDITVKEFNSKFITLFGEIAPPSQTGQGGPGRYALEGRTLLLDFIIFAGGPTNDANLNQVLVRRKNGKSTTINLFDAIIKGGVAEELVLDDGDIINVPSVSQSENRVFVYGEVGRSGAFPFTGKSIKMFDIISQAGGVTLFAKENQTRVIRGDISEPEVISVDLESLIENGDQIQNVDLINGDLVYVPRTVIGDASRFLQQINVLIDLISKPASIRDVITDSPVLP